VKTILVFLVTIITAASPSELWAVGRSRDWDHSFILRGDGTRWTVTFEEPSGFLGDISALPTGEAWAVSTGGVLHLDGADWKSVPTAQWDWWSL
jgi:hypothetical protein